jgi:L-asparagine transporter-like permease
LLVTAQDGNLPKILQKENKTKMAVNMMILQAVIITFWGIVYVVLPGGVNSSFWMLFALTTTIYIVMYLFMYAALLNSDTPAKSSSFFHHTRRESRSRIVGPGDYCMVFLFSGGPVPTSQISGWINCTDKLLSYYWEPNYDIDHGFIHD